MRQHFTGRCLSTIYVRAVNAATRRNRWAVWEDRTRKWTDGGLFTPGEGRKLKALRLRARFSSYALVVESLGFPDGILTVVFACRFGGPRSSSVIALYLEHVFPRSRDMRTSCRLR